MDGERRPDPGEPGPGLPAAEDAFWTDPVLLHPADLPLHVREQKDGHHSPGGAASRVCSSDSVWSECVLMNA